MKKFICLLAVILLCWMGCAYADDCEHVYRIDAGSMFMEQWIIMGPNTHEYREYYWGTCEKCGDSKLIYIGYGEKLHELTLNSKEHDNESQYHYYHYVCEKCGYMVTTSNYCPNEDCAYSGN